MAISCSAAINSNGKLDSNYEAIPKNGVERSASHAQFGTVIVDFSCSVEIDFSETVKYNFEANSENGVERSSAGAQS